MKNFNLIKYVLFGLLIITSCSKEDDSLLLNEKEKNIESNSNDNSTNIQAREIDGAITLYHVKNFELKKVKDYKVSGEDVAHQKDEKKHQEIWAYIKKLAPKKYLETISEFLIYNGKVQSSSGFVIPANKEVSSWLFAIAVEDFSVVSDLERVVIHELSHIITLNRQQVDEITETSSCNTHVVFTGCSKEKSYVNILFNKYWKDIYEEYEKALIDGKHSEFLQKYGDRFISQYAGTNPMEDLAETITDFIDIDEIGKVEAIYQKKMVLMKSFPEIVAFRNHVRKVLYD